MAVSCRVFSDSTWKMWEDSGKKEVVEKFKSFVQQDEIGSPLFSKHHDINKALYELLMAVLNEKIKKDDGKLVLLNIMDLHSDISSQLVEVISLIDIETSMLDNVTDKRRQFLSFLSDIQLESLCTERLDLDTLGDCGVVKNKRLFHTKQIKLRTKLFYKQQKFNLLREESEGYAKLATELNQNIDETITPFSMIQVVRSLIGCFNLDPNRVLDLILEAFECHPGQHLFYTELVRRFPCDAGTITELLGFKLCSYTDNFEKMKAIYIFIALLLQADILKLGDIYCWLTPEDSSLKEEYSKFEASVQEFVRKAYVVSTKDKDNKEKEKEGCNNNNDDDKEKEDIRNVEKYFPNQKIQLCIALVEVGNWTHFLEIANRFPDYYVISCYPVSKTICDLAHKVIEPVYRKACNLPSRIKGKPFKTKSEYLVPVPAASYKDLSELFQILCKLGPYLYHDTLLMYKVLRVGKAVLSKIIKKSQDKQDLFYYEFLNLLDECLLPGLSLLESHPSLAEEIWECLKLYPYHVRYTVYSKWKSESPLIHPIILKHQTILLKKAKYIMMRVTKETVKPVSRSVGKLVHNNPGPVFEYVLKQVMLYDNLILPVVDSFKYLTSLSYDVLGYCIVDILSQDRERISNDGMSISTWLQSLSAFCGSSFKKYNIDTSGILQLVANQLKNEKSVDLLILREIVQKMGGIETSENLTTEQIDALAGGEILRREAGQYQQERNIKRSSMRLKDNLIENKLAIPLLLLMAQQRSSVVYTQKEALHLKLVGRLYDECHDTMVQFGSFLFQMLSIEEFSSLLPAIDVLLSEYHINADIAFFLARPLFNHLVTSKFDELKKKDKSERKNSDVRKQLYLEANSEVFDPLVASIKPHYGLKVWEDMDPSFFLTFWSFSMSDLEVPHAAYEKEISKLTSLIAQSSKRDDTSANKRKKELDRLTSLRDKLVDEEKKQKEHVEHVHARLEKEKDRWFMLKGARSPKNDTVTAFLQLCLFPRCTFSSLDAVYCAKFVRILHSLKTPNFSTIICYDRMFCDITYTVASCTESEAKRYGRFLLGTLDTVMLWHSSKAIYEKECYNYPGFVTKFRVSKQEANDYVDYENYRHVVHKWHYKITKVKLEEKTKRKDLHVLANSYLGHLKAKRPQFIPESEFHFIRKVPAKAAEIKKENLVNGTASDSTQKISSTAPPRKEKLDGKEKRKSEDVEEEKAKRIKKETNESKVAEHDKNNELESKGEHAGTESAVVTNAAVKKEHVSHDGSPRSNKRRKTDHGKVSDEGQKNIVQTKDTEAVKGRLDKRKKDTSEENNIEADKRRHIVRRRVKE